MVEVSRDGTRIRSVTRAAELLLLIASLPEHERSVARLASALNTSVPTVYHLLNTLVDAKMLARDERKQYRLGFAFELLAAAYTRESTLPPELLRPLKWIVDATGESGYFAAWRQGRPAVLAHLGGSHAVQVTNALPDYLAPPNARASGKLLLAFGSQAQRDSYLATNPLKQMTPKTITDPETFAIELQVTREKGFAVEIEEFAAGVACVSVPIWSRSLLVGAYTIAAPVERYRQNMDQYLACLREAAKLAEAGA